MTPSADDKSPTAGITLADSPTDSWMLLMAEVMDLSDRPLTITTAPHFASIAAVALPMPPVLAVTRQSLSVS